MAEEGPPLNYFPDPPPFFKHFTAENLKRLKDIEKQASDVLEPPNNTADTFSKLSNEQVLALPAELRYLVPPPPPTGDESFHVFGERAKSSGTNNFTQTMDFVSKTLGEQFILSDWTYTQLYPSTTADLPTTDPTSTSNSTEANIDRQQYLNRFNRSIIIEFISLLGIIALDPKSEHKDKKLKHILTLVCNMHALINEYRPHQARETLIRIMEEQVGRKKAEVQGIRDMRGKVEAVLEGFGKAVNGEIWQDREAVKCEDEVWTEENKRREIQRGAWDALDEILGQ